LMFRQRARLKSLSGTAIGSGAWAGRPTAAGSGRAIPALGDVMDVRQAMKPRIVCAGVLLLSFAGEAIGANANEIVAACKSVMSTPHNASEAQKQGFCAGAVEGIGHVDPGICTPMGSTLEQWIRVVIRYIDSRPARLQEDFYKLAQEALRDAWPCPEGRVPGL
jgi:hypothetical protein